jgi:3-dehydroquinate dehydratase-2
MKILILNGPNLNLLGRRQPEIYGTTTMADIMDDLHRRFPKVDFEYFQSNHEGAIIDRLQSAGYGPETVDGVVLNAGGYTHTSVAIADAVAAISVPVIEVHISNVAAREEFRHHSMLSAVCRGTIAGLGNSVYRLAVSALAE